MKLKKLYSCFICYLTLIAFIGIIGIEVSSHSTSLNKKTEAVSGKKDLATGPDLVFEEERDLDDSFDHTFLSPACFLFNFSGTNQLSFDLVNPLFQTKKGSLFKTLLFITYCSLRL